MYATTASQQSRSESTSRFIDAMASRERVSAPRTQKTLKQWCSRSARAAASYAMVPMIDCDFVPAEREARRLNVQQRRQHMARSAHPPPM